MVVMIVRLLQDSDAERAGADMNPDSNLQVVQARPVPDVRQRSYQRSDPQWRL